jgi:hypothetical protein
MVIDPDDKEVFDYLRDLYRMTGGQVVLGAAIYLGCKLIATAISTAAIQNTPKSKAFMGPQ